MKIVLFGVAIAVFMAVAQDRGWPQKVGVTGGCTATAAPLSEPDGYWYSCKEGLINGFPNLEPDACSRRGTVQRQEIWRCDTPLASPPGA